MRMPPFLMRSVFALSLLKPGALCSEIFARLNSYLSEHGLPQEQRVSMHGMGYDVVERPLMHTGFRPASDALRQGPGWQRGDLADARS
jgi:hypothetical protein